MRSFPSISTFKRSHTHTHTQKTNECGCACPCVCTTLISNVDAFTYVYRPLQPVSIKGRWQNLHHTNPYGCANIEGIKGSLCLKFKKKVFVVFFSALHTWNTFDWSLALYIRTAETYTISLNHIILGFGFQFETPVALNDIIQKICFTFCSIYFTEAVCMKVCSVITSDCFRMSMLSSVFPFSFWCSFQAKIQMHNNSTKLLLEFYN